VSKILQDVDEKRAMIIGSIILDDEIHEIKDEDAFHLTAAIEGKTEYFII